MITIDSTDYEILPTRSATIETISLLELIDDYRQQGGETTELEWQCHRVEDVLQIYGLQSRVVGGYVAGNCTLFSLDSGNFAGPAIRGAVRRVLDAREVKSCPGVLLVAW